MLGFEIYIFPKSHYIAHTKMWEREERWKHFLAAWATSDGGYEWIDDLVKKGVAFELPSDEVLLLLYKTKLSAIKHIFKGNIPEPKGPGVVRDIEINESRISECSDDEELIIEAWDQS